MSVGEVEQVRAQAAQEGVPILTLLTGGIDDRDRIFEGFREGLPMDPPNYSSRSWEALSDSLFGGLLKIEASRVVIVWEDALKHESLDIGNPSEGLSILEEVADQLENRHITGEFAPKVVSVIVISDECGNDQGNDEK
ncbi:barstar family protein [Streptomyces subrutilus]|nr:barstar family protein [Streptomyces subrutilus]